MSEAVRLAASCLISPKSSNAPCDKVGLDFDIVYENLVKAECALLPKSMPNSLNEVKIKIGLSRRARRGLTPSISGLDEGGPVRPYKAIMGPIF